MQLQAMILSIQKVNVDGKTYSKCFIGLPANNDTEAVSSVMQLSVQEDKIESVFRSVVENNLKLGELVSVDVAIQRGSQNSIKQVVTGISSAQRPAIQAAPQQPAQQQQQQQEKK